MAGQAHHTVGDAVEQDHDGVGDLVERHKRASREQRIALGGEDGERLGNQLAHHHVQRGHDEVADGHGHHADQGLGQVQHLEQRTDKSGERGLAQPAQSQRRQRDAQLTGGQVLVDVLGNVHGAFRTLLALLDGQLELGFSNAHQSEFGDNEKRVHGQEQGNKNQA